VDFNAGLPLKPGEQPRRMCFPGDE